MSFRTRTTSLLTTMVALGVIGIMGVLACDEAEAPICGEGAASEVTLSSDPSPCEASIGIGRGGTYPICSITLDNATRLDLIATWRSTNSPSFVRPVEISAAAGESGTASVLVEREVPSSESGTAEIVVRDADTDAVICVDSAPYSYRVYEDS